MRRSLLVTGVVATVTLLFACRDDDDATVESVDPAASAYCDLVEESVEIQNEVGPDGATPEQQQEMLDIAMRLQDEAPTDLQDANVAVAQIPPDATGQERADAIRAYSEALNEWTKANCA